MVTSSIEESFSSTTGSKTTSITFQADIEYEYVLNNQTYKNNRISYGDYGSSDESVAKEMVNRYPIGKTVTVYYLSDDPSESVLEPEGTKKGIVAKFIVGSVFLFSGLFIAIVPYLSRKIRKNIASETTS